MTTIAPTEYTPDIAIPPGETLRELLESLGMTQAELARRIDRPPTKVNSIIKGTKRITENTAIDLGRVTPYPTSFWVNLEKNYRLTLARLKDEQALARDIDWVRNVIPYSDLVKREHLSDTREPRERLESVLRFFGVSNVKVWKKDWGRRIASTVAFRQSEKQAKYIGRIAVWLRLGELAAQGKPCKPYNRRKFKVALRKIRSATAKSPKVFEPLLRDLTDCGVVVSLVKEIPGAGISGATWWFSKNKAHIQLSLLFKTDDQFWFSFFHEAGHVLLHGKDEMFIERTSKKKQNDKEEEANQFATDFLIPPAQASRLESITSPRQAVEFAEELGISPGIVVGQLQHAKHITPQTANYWSLKQRFDWAED